MSTLKATYLQNASSATVNMTNDTSGNVTVGGTLAMTGGGSFLRNRIINGDMRIDQRNAGASGTGNVYTVDRFAYYGAAASKGTWQQNAGSVTPPAGFTNYLGFTSSSSYTAGASEQFNIYQPIEGLNVADLAWGTANAKTVTVSFWVRSSLTGTFGGAIYNSAVNRSYPYSYTISSANTWEQKSVTITGDTTGTWLTTNGVGLYLNFSLGAGATVSNTAGSWYAGRYDNATGATSIVGTNGATFYITGVQLEVGSVATPFERRLYGQELALCQRYFYAIACSSANARMGFAGNYSSGSAVIYPTSYVAVDMRNNSKSVTISALSDFKTEELDGGVQTPTAIALDSQTYNNITLSVTCGSNFTFPANLLAANGNARIYVSAEL